MAPSVDLIGALRLAEQKAQRIQWSAEAVRRFPEREDFRRELEHDLAMMVASCDDVKTMIAKVRQPQ